MNESSQTEAYERLFGDLKREISALDPVAFAENYLTIDGKPFEMTGNGWKFMADVYRDVAAQATSPNAKPMVILKGRQIGATVLAAVLSLYFTASGLYGAGKNRPPIRVLHAFPTLGIMSKYAKDKLAYLIQNSQENYIAKRSIYNDPVNGKTAPEDTLTEKTFLGFNKLRVDSVGRDSDRLRGLSQDVLLFDECFPYDQCIDTEDGKKAIGYLYKLWKRGEPLPRVKSFNETTSTFEYKRILNAWDRGPKELIQLTCGNREIRCTANHPFLTENGWIRAQNLMPGDLLKVCSETPLRIRSLNDDQMQVVMGSFLGDGHLSKHKLGRYRLVMTHGIEQSDYCKWKASLFGAETTYIEKNGYAQKPAVRFNTKCFGLNQWIPEQKTTCPQWVLDNLDARGLAIWFMDDGSANAGKNGAHISTCSFDEDSQRRIVLKLQSFGIECRYALYDGYYSIYIKKAGYLRLCELIRPYVHSRFTYKMPNYSDAVSKYEWSNQFHNYGLTVVDKVSKINKVETVFDIEVEDNHNFVITSRTGSPNMGGPIVHNCQDMSQQAIDNALRILTSAQYGPRGQGVQLYFGTPKQAGSYFWNIWNESDQRFYQLRCVKCGHYFFLYTIGNDDWRKIWIEKNVIECTNCHHRQEKHAAIEGGKWVATKEGERKYIGYHMNVLLNPIYTKEAVLQYDPDLNRNRSRRAWENETMGNFYSTSNLTLTIEELRSVCGDETRGLAKEITTNSDKVYVMGIDWGDKVESEHESRGKSYTVIVILSINNAGIFTVENAWRLPNNEFQYQINVIEHLFTKFKIRTAVADYMWGQQQVNHIQNILDYGSRFLGCINSGSANQILTYKPKEMRVVVNKDQMIDEMFSLFRHGKIQFPMKGDTFDRIYWLLEHCTSMELTTAQKYGSPVKKYEKGIGPNDGFMALMYAVIGYRFLATNGFKGNVDRRDGPRPMPLMAFLPKLK